MHIPDNYLSPQTCAVMAAAMVPVWIVSVKKVKEELPKVKLPMLGVGAAFSFLGMMFNIPVPGGTTGHAVMRLNRQDNGYRRCVLVTNNEVSEEDVKQLKAKGYKHGDPEWDKLGICRYITIPRLIAAVTGFDSTGKRIDSSN